MTWKIWLGWFRIDREWAGHIELKVFRALSKDRWRKNRCLWKISSRSTKKARNEAEVCCEEKIFFFKYIFIPLKKKFFWAKSMKIKKLKKKNWKIFEVWKLKGMKINRKYGIWTFPFWSEQTKLSHSQSEVKP